MPDPRSRPQAATELRQEEEVVRQVEAVVRQVMEAVQPEEVVERKVRLPGEVRAGSSTSSRPSLHSRSSKLTRVRWLTVSYQPSYKLFSWKMTYRSLLVPRRPAIRPYRFGLQPSFPLLPFSLSDPSRPQDPIPHHPGLLSLVLSNQVQVQVQALRVMVELSIRVLVRQEEEEHRLPLFPRGWSAALVRETERPLPPWHVWIRT